MIVRNIENEMFRVMQAIYDSNVPISFKGSMVLRTFLYEKDFSGTVRPTKDIDANWTSENAPDSEQIADEIQKALDQNEINLKVNVYRNYGEGRSAGLKFCNSNGESVFTMDIDVNRPVAGLKLYAIDRFTFSGLIPEQMLSDKIVAISTDKVFRRIKDLVDIYYFSRCFQYDPEKLKKVMRETGKVVLDFHGFLTRKDELKYAYDKFRMDGISNKPEFDEVYQAVRNYICVFFPTEAE